ncbi:MAG: hypothetical protein ACI4LA_01360 [Emergencia sp.]
MTDGVIVIVDLGHEDCEMIRRDVESLGVSAVICPHDADQAQLDAFGEIRGFILNGGPNRKVNGFRVDASQVILDSKIPTYSVDHASMKGVDLYSWPEDEAERREKIRRFLQKDCGLEL